MFIVFADWAFVANLCDVLFEANKIEKGKLFLFALRWWKCLNIQFAVHICIRRPYAVDSGGHHLMEILFIHLEYRAETWPQNEKTCSNFDTYLTTSMFALTFKSHAKVAFWFPWKIVLVGFSFAEKTPGVFYHNGRCQTNGVNLKLFFLKKKHASISA